MAEFETGYPSIRQLQGFAREKQEVEFKLVTGDTLTGQIVWQDAYCICLGSESGQVTIWRNAIVYHQVKS